MTRHGEQTERASRFRELHGRDRAFIVPNPWDIGSARLLARLGFEALATTSAGVAFSLGQRDNTIDRNRMLAHVAAIVAATGLPVSADLGNGYGDDPGSVAETIRLAAATGAVGGSIEDACAGGRPSAIYDFGAAVERIHAAAEAARALPFPFTLTARAENFLVGKKDLDDTIKRLQAYQDAGADVLYAPGLRERDQIAAVLASVDRPVNLLMGLDGAQLDLATLSRMGVARISVGSALARAAYGALLDAAREMLEQGSFTSVAKAIDFAEISALLAG